MRKQPQKYTALKHKAHVMYKVRPTGTTLNWEGKVVTVLLKGQKGNNEGWGKMLSWDTSQAGRLYFQCININ